MLSDNLDKLAFFDNDGRPIEFNQIAYESDGETEYTYETDIYLKPVSVSLYDNFNIYILEKYIDGDEEKYRFPILDYSERFSIEWDAEETEIPEYFLYAISKNINDNRLYIDKKKSEIFDEIVTENIPAPYQFNVGFSPTDEVQYRKSLMVIKEVLVDGVIDRTLAFKINFYSEGIAEDERFKIQLENFGIKLNRTDALAIKDYNILEAYPDWEIVNNTRKHLILEKEELVPYLGTYRCLKNIISLFGYSDSINILEYYKNINMKSPYFNKYTIVNISDVLNDDKVEEIDLSRFNSNIKDDPDYVKSGMLGLAYEFNKKSGEYTENGTPIMERNDEFTTKEMFFKLHKLEHILERDYLPVNVFIGDVIGEWSYYVSFPKYVWSDKLFVTSLNLNDVINVNAYPENVHSHIYDVSQLNTRTWQTPIGGYQYPEGVYVPTNYYTQSELDTNDYSKMPFPFPNNWLNPYRVPDVIIKTKNSDSNTWEGVQISCSEQTGVPKIPNNVIDYQIEGMCNAINSFYEMHKSKDFNKIHDRDYDYIDSSVKPVGFPVILKVNLGELTIEDLQGITAESSEDVFNKSKHLVDNGTYDENEMFDDPEKDYYTKTEYNEETELEETYIYGVTGEDLIYRNYTDIEWHIEYNTPANRKNDVYRFDYVGNIRFAYQLPQILPYVGRYDVSVKIRNTNGNSSYAYRNDFIVVEPTVPEVVAMYPGDDVFELSEENCALVKISDFGTSLPNEQRINVLDNAQYSDITVNDMAISSSRIRQYLNDTEVFDPINGVWESLSDTDNQNADCLGFFEGKALRMTMFKSARGSDLFHLRPIDCVLSSDILHGFWFANPSKGDRIYFRKISDTRKLEIENTGEEEHYYYEFGDFLNYEDLCNKLNSENSDLPDILKQFTYYPVETNENLDKDSEYGNYPKIIIAEARDFSESSALAIEYVGNIIGSKYTFGVPEYYENIDKDGTKFKELYSTGIDQIDIMNLNEGVLEEDYLIENLYAVKDGVIDTEENDGNVYGTIPMVCEKNLLNMDSCKIHVHSFTIPLFKHVFFFINNVNGKNLSSVEWTLRDVYGNLVIKIRKNPYFIYNFQKIGNYELSVSVKDNNNNVAETSMKRFINVVSKDDYLSTVKSKLANK